MISIDISRILPERKVSININNRFMAVSHEININSFNLPNHNLPFDLVKPYMLGF